MGLCFFIFFFFKQKTAYEISACLVGSEMCIRDSKQTSLSVQKENYAVNMYQKIGFKVVSETEEEYIMVCELQ